ncbi:MAG: hypothetical protein IPN01_04270 [Deltaproteobacteria bacterium]|nr:hypothetical protein [Deltaproteobacteria bacterium]
MRAPWAAAYATSACSPQRRRAERRLVLGEPKVETVLALSEDAGHIFVDLRLA